MISIQRGQARLCDGITRRDFVRLGAIGTMGLSLADLLRAEAAQAASGLSPGRAKSVILFFLMGGQSQLDTWDMKPDAPEGIRGEFKPVATNVDGIRICEHMPMLARRADRFALIRSMTHHVKNHAPAGYYALSGMEPKRDSVDFGISPDDYPGLGCVATLLEPSTRPVPSYVQLSPPVVGDNATQMPGLQGGFLGARYDPLKVTGDPNEAEFKVEELSLPDGVSEQRFQAR